MTTLVAVARSVNCLASSYKTYDERKTSLLFCFFVFFLVDGGSRQVFDDVHLMILGRVHGVRSEEIEEIAQGKVDESNNVLKNSPHTEYAVLNDNWDKPYSREKAAYPLEFVRNNKFWPAVARVDNAYGDRNLVCNCLPVEDYLEEV